MKSAVAISYELDDAAEAARQLADGIREKLTLKKNSVGIFSCDADMDGAAVTAELKALLGIEVAGMTTLATLAPDGYHEAAAVLTVLTADDCVFSPAASAPFAGGAYEKKIVDTYAKTVPAGETAPPGVVFVFCPCGMAFSADLYPDTLTDAVGGAPLIGGVCSDDYDYARARVFLSGAEYRDSMVAVSIFGNARPAFALRHVTSRFAERIRRVARAEGNLVYEVGDETFVKYLEGFGLRTDVDDPLLAFNSYPMMLTREGGDEVPLMRHISGLDLKAGTGTFLGDVPEGSLANICLVSKDDVRKACEDSVNALLAEVNTHSDYEYSAVFCFTCCGRAMILGGESDAEGKLVSRLLPESLTLMGAYCLGEICPTLYKDGVAANRFHNCSITFCMI
ncbi:MAG: FIST C-terminal domain-containing protein [Oscillospiraceae bacterium]|jgi:hypothetical protein|nr:FIST C-terminal domain-containing protein [Oscillospiraceae bacterium]